ncbi:MAG: C40 family peptidase [Bacteroidetes bacterium]|nr:C40 family peptidase [Bacteroidota bacterium]
MALICKVNGQTEVVSGKLAVDSLYNYYYANYYTQSFGFEISEVKNPYLYEIAEDWIDVNYKYAGDDMNGTDCSHFSSNVYNYSYAKSLFGSSADIQKSCTYRVERENLKEGDLVFFAINSKNHISHVGVYLCNNKFVHATTQAGVIISDLNEEYYNKYFTTGGRY